MIGGICEVTFFSFTEFCFFFFFFVHCPIIYGIPSMTQNNMELVKNHCDGGGQRQESPD